MSRVKIGWSKKETSIPEGVALFGQMHLRVSEGILDPLYATALVIDGGEGHVIFVTCDLEAHRENSISETIRRVTQLRPEISPQSILMGVTHSHTASSILPTPEESPDGKPVYSGVKFREHLIGKCVEAWDSRAEGGIAYGYGYACISNSRRVCYDRDMSIGTSNRGVAPNGHAMMYGKTGRPEFQHYEAGADHFLNALFTFDTENRITGMLLNVPCPSQLYEHALKQSSDYWHDVREAVKAEFGENVYVLPQCAAAGDLTPRLLHYQKAQTRRLSLKYGAEFAENNAFHADSKEQRIALERKDIANRILTGAKEILEWAARDIRTEVTVESISRTVSLRRRFITDAEKQWCEETLEMMEKQLPTPDSPDYSYALTHFRSIQGRNRRALQRYAEQEANPNLERTLFAARIDDCAFTTCPFELFMDYMHRIQARSPFTQTFVAQLAGDAGASYLATERAMANMGYSASIFCNPVGAEGGQQYVEATLEMLNDLNK